MTNFTSPQVSRAFSTFDELGQQVLKTSYHEFQQHLTRFIDHCTDNPVVSEVLRPLRESQNPKTDIDVWYSAFMQSGGTFIGSKHYTTPNDELQRLSLHYKFFCAISNNTIDFVTFAIDAFAETNFDEMLRRFNASFFRPWFLDVQRLIKPILKRALKGEGFTSESLSAPFSAALRGGNTPDNAFLAEVSRALREGGATEIAGLVGSAASTDPQPVAIVVALSNALDALPRLAGRFREFVRVTPPSAITKAVDLVLSSLPEDEWASDLGRDQITERDAATSNSLRELLTPLFAEGGRFHGRYDPPDWTRIVSFAAGSAAWQVPVFQPGAASPRLLRLYPFGDDASDLRHAHWRNESRALHRLATNGHPSLPRLLEAGRIVESHRIVGYMIIENTYSALTPGHPLLSTFAQDRHRAFREFFHLVEAVALLHEEGLLHRNLTPRATRAPEQSEDPIRLDGFQMSAFAATWLQGTRMEADANEQDAEGYVAACISPERWLARRETGDYETFASDVFSLGMIGFGWLVRGFDEWQTKLAGGSLYDAGTHSRLLSQLGSSLADSGLPPLLQQLLRQMTNLEQVKRPPNAGAVFDELSRGYGHVLASLEAPVSANAGRLQLYYLRETLERLHEDALGRSPPSDPDLKEYAELLEEDLASGTLTWSITGALRWKHGRDPEQIEKMTAARAALIGERYTYFCQALHHGRAAEDPRVLIVKYMTDSDSTPELRRQPRQRSLPPVEPSLFDPDASTRRPVPTDTPSWDPLLRDVRFEERHAPAAPVVRAGNWLLGALRAQVVVQEYGFKRLADADVGAVTQSDEGSAWTDDSERSAFARLAIAVRARPPMGTLFADLARRALDEDQQLSFILRQTRQETGDRFQFARKLDEHSVELARIKESLIPSQGYLRPDDTGERSRIARQYLALEAVEKRHPYLAAQLANPTAVELAPELRADFDRLDTATRSVVEKVLSSWPISIVQGPPGTGKTFLACQVIRAVLEIDPFSRILVAAQSHDALDNLLEGVVESVDTDRHIVLREYGARATDKVSHKAIEFGLLRSAERLREGILAKSESQDSMALGREWRVLARKKILDLDLMQRLQRSASVAFATCTSATPAALGLETGRGFDWVIVEEAAKAWFTELLIPMVHGTRWLLIGDHHQLHPFEERRVEDMLARDASDQITERSTGVEVDRDWLRYLNHFKTMMSGAERSHGLDPRITLSEQRRMHPEIGGLVSTVFYDDNLKTHSDARRSHDVVSLDWLKDTALTWVDTSSFGSSGEDRRANRGGYENECEARLIAWLADRLRSEALSYDPNIRPLAILTPYRAQVEAIRRRLSAPERELVDTTDAFQGRESEIVLLSLVRNNRNRDSRSGLGFLAEHERVNVALSRARRLLVIVGGAKHFESFSDTVWPSIVRYVQGNERFTVDADRIGFNWRRNNPSRGTK